MDEADKQRAEQELALVAGGDAAALGRLYDLLSARLFGIACHILRDPAEAEEALQEAMVSIWKNARTYDARRSSVATWSILILRHKALDRLRSRARHQRVQERVEAEGEPPGQEAGTDEQVLGAERRQQVRAALAQLPAEQRGVLEMAFFQGLTHEEIHERTGQPLGTVKARIRRGLLRLRDLLGH